MPSMIADYMICDADDYWAECISVSMSLDIVCDSFVAYGAV